VGGRPVEFSLWCLLSVFGGGYSRLLLWCWWCGLWWRRSVVSARFLWRVWRAGGGDRRPSGPALSRAWDFFFAGLEDRKVFMIFKRKEVVDFQDREEVIDMAGDAYPVSGRSGEVPDWLRELLVVLLEWLLSRLRR
jgi:hypothetical protein